MSNGRKFLERMNEIDDELLERAESSVVHTWRGRMGRKWIVLAAVIGIAVITALTASVLYIRGNQNDSGANNDIQEIPISDVIWTDTRDRNGNSVIIENAAYVWPWNCRAIYDQYTKIDVNGKTYSSRSYYYGGEVYANQIGEKLTEAECEGYDAYEEATRRIRCEVFEIIGVDSARIVAVKYEGFDGYYPFMNDERQVLKSLGELIDALNLTNNVKLNDFYYDEENDGNDVEEHYVLSNEKSDELWNIIKTCANAPSVSDDNYDRAQKNISFALNSTTLGVHNLSFSFSEDGYLWTNIEGYAYCYYIGDSAVAQITDIALKNKHTAPISKTQYLIGTVTEIGEDYIKIDDSIMMINPDDGIEFTVYANHMNVRRYIISGFLKVGDTVRVEHGYLPKESYTEIINATNLEECRITKSGDILFYE